MEILVHVSAPSSADDDTRYRAMIDAMLSLQPVSTITSPSAPASTSISTPNSPFLSADTRPSRLTQFAVTAAGSDLIASPVLGPCSPAAADGGLRPQSQSHSQSPLHFQEQSQSESQSESHDSNLDLNSALASPTKSQSQSRSRSRSGHLQRVSSLIPGPSTIGPDTLAPAPLDPLQPACAPDSISHAAVGATTAANTNDSGQSLGSLISVIPDSQPSVQEQEQGSLRSRAEVTVPRSSSDPSSSPKVGLAPRPSDPTSLDSEPIPKRPRLEETAPNPSTMAPKVQINSSTHQKQHFPYSLPLQIYPPPPPISTSHFTTHITPTLSMLTQRLKPERIYKPIQQTRELNILERGYWLLQIQFDSNIQSSSTLNLNQKNQQLHTSWDTPFFHRFWTFLSDFIGKDARAGWGVWCILEDSSHQDTKHPHSNSQQHQSSLPSTASTGSEITPSQSTSSHDKTTLSLRVYAWGEIAMHTYLLLFLASERRIKGMGAEWHDSGEEVVIRMP